MAPRELIIYRSGAMGDVLMTFPVLQALREHWPEAVLTFVAPPETGMLAVVSGWADRLLSSDAAWVGRWHAGDAAALRETIAPADALVAFANDEDGQLRRAAREAGITRVLVWPPLPPEETPVNMTDHLLRALEDWGIAVQGIAPVVRLTEKVRAEGRKVALHAGVPPDAPYSVVHSGSGSPARNWPEMLRVARLIEERFGLSVIVNRGPAEVERGIGNWPKEAHLVGPLSVETLAGLIACARLYVGNDTGPSHLAAALGVPTIAVFGPTDPRRWAPRGPHVAVVSPSEGKRWPSLAQVEEAIFALIGQA